MKEINRNAKNRKTIVSPVFLYPLSYVSINDMPRITHAEIIHYRGGVIMEFMTSHPTHSL
jgi:hypothetical protein